MITRTAEGMAAALRADHGRKAPLNRLRQLLYQVEPAVEFSPTRRRRLRDVLEELAAAGVVSLPKGKAQYDRLEDPPLPRFVLVAGVLASASYRAPGAQTFPWLPELRWAVGLRPRLREDEMRVLQQVDTFLRARRGGAPTPTVPLQERSLQLFGDEKRLGELIHQRLFAPGRLDLALLGCREVHPPFVYQRLSDLPVMLAVENSATYDTMLQVLDGSGPVGVVAYGAGKHFVLSVAAAVHLVPRPTRILYFGDVDADGLLIPVRATATAVEHGLPPVEPAEALYELLCQFAAAAESGVVLSASDDTRTAWLPANMRVRMATLLRFSGRLAQEHVGLELLRRDRGWINGLLRQIHEGARL